MAEDDDSLETMRHQIMTTIVLLALTLSATLTSPSSGAAGEPPRVLWQPPLGAPLKVDAAYDLSRGPYRAGHRGIDLRAVTNEHAVAPTGGLISFVGTVVNRPVISIQVDEHTTVSLEPLASDLSVGDSVARGDPLGTVAIGGHCESGCLHLGVRVEGNYVNPLRYFIARAVLAPW